MALFDKTILVVEDDESQVNLLRSLFLARRFTVEFASNGMGALEILNENIPTAIILDIMMPKMDGYAFLENIKENVLFKNIPVIILSALPAIENREKALSMGAYDYVEKPFTPSMLANKTMEAIEDAESVKCL